MNMNNNVCKYMRTKFNYSPNDYELYFNKTDIPLNINYNGSIELSKIMRQYTPLSKKVHLNFNALDKKTTAHLSLSTRLRVNGEEVEFK